jgi:hypothetical protein
MTLIAARPRNPAPIRNRFCISLYYKFLYYILQPVAFELRILFVQYWPVDSVFGWHMGSLRQCCLLLKLHEDVSSATKGSA